MGALLFSFNSFSHYVTLNHNPNFDQYKRSGCLLSPRPLNRPRDIGGDFLYVLSYSMTFRNTVTSFQNRNLEITHTPSISLSLMVFQQLQLLFSRLIFSYILALSLGIWRSGEGNARDYGSSVTSPSVCHERVKLMAQRGVGGLQSFCRRLWKRMPFIADWPSQAVAEASHLISRGWGVALHGFKVNVPVLMKLPWSTGLLGRAMSECPSPCWSLQVCCGS